MSQIAGTEFIDGSAHRRLMKESISVSRGLPGYDSHHIKVSCDKDVKL